MIIGALIQGFSQHGELALRTIISKYMSSINTWE